MQSSIQTAPISKPKLWTGRVMSALAVLFLLFDDEILRALIPLRRSVTS